MQAQATILILSNAPDAECARAIAAHLVEQRLAACVNILAPCHSVYRWQGAVEQAEEIPLLIKAPAAHYDQIEAAILALHPYQTPEIIALSLTAGLPAYLAWVSSETTPA